MAVAKTRSNSVFTAHHRKRLAIPSVKNVGTAASAVLASLLANLTPHTDFVPQSAPAFLHPPGQPRAAVPTLLRVDQAAEHPQTAYTRIT